MQRSYFTYSNGEAEPPREFLGSTAAAVAGTAAIIVVFGLGLGPALFWLVSPYTGSKFYPYLVLAVTTVAFNQFTEMQLNLLSVEQKAREYTSLVMAFSLTAGMLSLAFVVGLRWEGRGLLVGKLLASAILAAYVTVPWRSWFAAARWSAVKVLLAISGTLVPYHFLALGLAAADRFILKAYRPMSEVGLYSVAYTLGMVMNIIVTSVHQAWAPEYFRLAPELDRRPTLGAITSALILGLIATSVFGMAIAQPFISLFLDRRYANSAPVVPIIIAALALHGFFALLQLAFRHLNRFSVVMWMTAVPFIVNIGLNFVLIPKYGLYGAAWATLIGYFAEAILTTVVAQKMFPIPLDWRKISVALAVLVGALVIPAARASHQGMWMATFLLVMAVVARKHLVLASNWFLSARRRVAQR